MRDKVDSSLAGLANRKDRGEATLSDGVSIKGGGTPTKLLARFPALGKCTSHLGLSLEDSRFGQPCFCQGHEDMRI